MGRGLSRLQKQILNLVYERRQGRDFDQEQRELHELEARSNRLLQRSPYRVHHDMRHAEIIAKLYDWPLWSGREGRHLRPPEGASVNNWGQNWSRGVIGLAEYNRKTAAYYRAISRLKARGLLKDQRAGLWITDEGMRVAEALVGARVS